MLARWAAGEKAFRNTTRDATEDLKMGPFKPAYTGQMNPYLSAINDLLRRETDQPTIGLILCKSKNQIVAEYTLRDIAKPLGIPEFHHLEQLPEQLEGTLPIIEA
jgi:hypothetical protein